MDHSSIAQPSVCGYLLMPSKSWGAIMVRFSLKVNFSSSITHKAAADILWRQGGHPAAIGSNFLDRYLTGHYWTQVLDQDTFRFSLCSSTNKLNGFVESGRSNTRTERKLWLCKKLADDMLSIKCLALPWLSYFRVSPVHQSWNS